MNTFQKVTKVLKASGSVSIDLKVQSMTVWHILSEQVDSVLLQCLSKMEDLLFKFLTRDSHEMYFTSMLRILSVTHCKHLPVIPFLMGSLFICDVVQTTKLLSDFSGAICL